MGYAAYPGPWGMSLNTPQSKTISFNKGIVNAYTLRVQTVTQGYSDAWDASVGCTPRVLDYNQLAIEHNNALDYLHLNYSTGGPYNLQAVYNAIINYCNANNKPLPTVSYQELVDFKNQVTNISGLLDYLQSRYNTFNNTEKSELNTLYQNLEATTTDEKQMLYCKGSITELINLLTHLAKKTNYWAYPP